MQQEIFSLVIIGLRNLEKSHLRKSDFSTL